ncbi:MAG TPA: hypothetical protein DDW84_05325 [Phycisphaerales bacterium]|nr:MAG: hypothetical protein A2Y13_05680 [Planctomycetes bacterium GWC2_45_44]HBG78257.1 hypothetical protein [Phycisphaerales bacterium]HBR18808.1 hypothetical protein [Phycisphaerales bacterium]
MNKRILNLSTYSVVLAVVPWFYAIFAEFLTPAITTIVASLAYLSCFASIVVAVIVIKRKDKQSVRLAQIALALNLLFILVVVFSLFFFHNHTSVN